MKNTKLIPLAISTITGLILTCSIQAQILSFDPKLPNTIIPDGGVNEDAHHQMKSSAKLPPLSSYAGTYVGVVVYYNIDNGVGDWEVEFRKNGTIGLSAEYQNKYPQANVSGRFLRDGTFQYTNKSSTGVTFVTTGKVDRNLQKLSARFTSSSAGTGTIICHKLVTK